MTDFIEELNKQIVPKYENYYVSYRQLREAITILKQREDVSESSAGFLKGILLPKDFTFGDTTAIHGMVEQRPEVRFISLLEHELSKINHFAALEVKTILASLRQVSKKLSRAVKGEDSLRTPKMTAFPSSSATDDLMDGSSRESKLAAIHSRLVNLSDELLTLEHYVQLNSVIFQKITREFDSQFSDCPPISTWFVPKLIDEPFRTIPFLGLSTVIGSLFSSCIPSQSLTGDSGSSLFPISQDTILRAKLVLASLFPLHSQPISVPIRQDELSRGPYVCATEWTYISITSDSCPIRSLSICSTTQTVSIDLHDKVCDTQSIPFVEVSDHVHALLGDHPTVGPIKVIQFNRTNFGSFWLAEQFRISIIEGANLRTIISDMNSVRYEWVSLEGALISVSEEAISTHASLGEILRNGSIQDLSFVDTVLSPLTTTQNEQVTIPDRTPEQIFSLPPSAPTPLLTVAVPEMSVPQLEQTAQPKITMIYPKNFMANERAFLAWISAISAQTGIGLSLVSKPGLSFIGSVLCLVALVFMWWSVVVFIRRFRHIRNTPRNDHSDQAVFSSMQLPTAFGFVQIIILVVQSLIVIFD